MNKIKVIAIFFIFTFIFSACNRNKVYEEYIKIDDYVWHNDKNIKFEFDIEDSLSLYNVYINVRHANFYPYNNLWLFVTSSAPNGAKSVDTIECVLAGNNGKWLGDGLGDIWDFQKPWKLNVRFGYKGKYRIEMEQAMRVDALTGVMDMGLKVEKVELR
jgi:gliding motility-associated lipoprotein GldH